MIIQEADNITKDVNAEAARRHITIKCTELCEHHITNASDDSHNAATNEGRPPILINVQANQEDGVGDPLNKEPHNDHPEEARRTAHNGAPPIIKKR